GYGTLQVMNTLGQLLYKKEVAMINREVISEINLAGLAEGIYFLNIVTDDQLYSQQFIISH
ncbi:MAG: T9SS type A sorting domain-containing protein, partial [Chitinophagales bacterium]|nr:T9SS type A sorting domain-containing protein [Chitinophagales bacterium]